jgi:lipopolysaccharide/colanic/teichoic acid biosynthesis glycosyltransferase
VTRSRQTKASGTPDSLLESPSAINRIALDETTFRRMIAIERKRTERSKAPFVLMLLEAVSDDGQRSSSATLHRIAAALLASSRDTDLIGWYKDDEIVGTMFTGLIVNDKRAVLDTFLAKVSTTLQNELNADEFNQVRISFHLFPDDWDHEKPGRPTNPALYPDLDSHDQGRRSVLIVKRVFDIAGSSAMVILFAPLFLAIALAIKLTSKGPVFYRQQRVGRYGQTFTFLKFRSMFVNNDHSVHKEFVTRLIASTPGESKQAEGDGGVYKLVGDKRITRVGKLLRRTSLDELPQFLNVLKGDMSLVGPRPPIPYELAAYQTWHRHRLLAVKPGITGLWQVMSRSSVRFDEMVRLDLRYASTWTPWLDLKILLRTPGAVIRGSGAY